MQLSLQISPDPLEGLCLVFASVPFRITEWILQEAVVHASNLSTWEAEADYLCEFKVSLVLF